MVERFPNEEEQRMSMEARGVRIDQKLYWLPSKIWTDLTPEQAINMIREKWNAVLEEDRSFFEEWSVLFTLPENEWAM